MPARLPCLSAGDFASLLPAPRLSFAFCLLFPKPQTCWTSALTCVPPMRRQAETHHSVSAVHVALGAGSGGRKAVQLFGGVLSLPICFARLPPLLPPNRPPQASR